jgi:small GTP-binding protein
MIGEATVGKSTIKERYLGIEFRPAYLQTVGADFTTKNQVIKENQSINIQIWDLAGQQGFSNIREAFYKGSDGAVLVFDVTNPKTLDNIGYWIKEVKKNLNLPIPMILVGNKIDLRENNPNSVTEQKGFQYAEDFSKFFETKMDYIESSAKTGENIDSIFFSISKLILRNKRSKQTSFVEKSFQIYLDEVRNHIELFFFKMLEDGPSCVSQTGPQNDIELVFKMAMFYATTLGQGASAHTGLFGPFPIPETTDKNLLNSQSLIYSFNKSDKNFTDSRAEGINYCFIVVAIAKDLLYQFNDNSIHRFFYNEIGKIQDVEEITNEFLLQLKNNLLNDVYILNYSN